MKPIFGALILIVALSGCGEKSPEGVVRDSEDEPVLWNDAEALPYGKMLAYLASEYHKENQTEPITLDALKAKEPDFFTQRMMNHFEGGRLVLNELTPSEFETKPVVVIKLSRATFDYYLDGREIER